MTGTEEIGRSIYLTDSDRYVVSLVVGYANDHVESPEQAAAAALSLTRDIGSTDTRWNVYDRHTGVHHQLDQDEFEQLVTADGGLTFELGDDC